MEATILCVCAVPSAKDWCTKSCCRSSFLTTRDGNPSAFRRLRVYGELLFRQAAWHATLLHPFLYVVDLERALNFDEAH